MFRRKGADELSERRTKQLEMLVQSNPSALRITPDSSVWEIPVVTKFGVLKFRVILPLGFPEQPPEMKLLVHATHPLVDQNLKIIHPKIVNWSVHSNIGLIIAEIADEFTRNNPAPVAAPPKPVQPPLPVNGIPNANGWNPMLPNPNPAIANPLLPNNNPVNPINPAVKPPAPAAANNGDSKIDFKIPIPDTFPVLDTKSTDQLQKILDDEVQFFDLFDSLEAVKNTKHLRDDFLTNVEQLATSNLSHKSEVKNYQTEISELRQTLAAKQDYYRALQVRLQTVIQSRSLQNMTKALQDKINDNEQIADRFVKDLADNKLDAQSFANEYQKVRCLHHIRSAKKERIRDLYGVV